MKSKKNRKRMRDLWSSMIRRCHNENHISYKFYGAKGIRVCERWRESLDNFIKDMGDREEGMTLDRIDSRGNYEPENCKWSTVTEQNRNKSDTRMINFNGKNQTMTAWAIEAGMSVQVLHYRITKMLLPIDKALSVQVTRNNRVERFK